MNKKYNFFLRCVFVFSLICINYCIVGCSDQNEVKGVTPKYIVSSDILLKDFITNENIADKKYVDEVIEVFGKIKEITSLNNRKTIILQTNTDSGIICDVNNSQQELLKDLKKNQLVHIKGICKGYLKDVILLNCFIDITNQHE
ncbi:OB-fold protein [Tenacibaculum sp. MEBiC06402]|uniref:OB-fold protein n=1 Tax=unclassified Tenacibaculum TaxID=2635139 RepID=UPI003B9A3642